MELKAFKCDTCGIVEIEQKNGFCDNEMLHMMVGGSDFDFCSIKCANIGLVNYGVTLTKT